MAENYKCLNPVGIQPPVKLSPQAPRLNTLDGKTVHLSICGEADIWVPLEKKLKTDYPNINLTVKKTSYRSNGTIGRREEGAKMIRTYQDKFHPLKIEDQKPPPPQIP